MAPPRRPGRPPPRRRGGAQGLPPVRVAGPAVPHGQRRPPRPRAARAAEGLSEGEGLRFEPLKADLFEPAKTRLIGRIARPGTTPTTRTRPARHPAARRGPVQGAAPAHARQGQRARKGKSQTRRVHLLRPARHQPARRGLRGPDVLHRLHRRRGAVRGRQERRPVRRLVDDPGVQGRRLRRRRVRHGRRTRTASRPASGSATGPGRSSTGWPAGTGRPAPPTTPRSR